MNIGPQQTPYAMFLEELVSVQPLDENILVDLFKLLKEKPDHYISFIKKETE